MKQELKRLFVKEQTGSKQMIEIIKWAATNNYDAIVFSLGKKLKENNEFIKLAKKYELVIEAGGHDFPLFVPKRLFFFQREIFRMEHGKRKVSPHFCPTNPETTKLITESAHFLFSRMIPAVTQPRVFHLLPDHGQENTWCACPACRAFSCAEQYIMAVNSAADILARLDPFAKLSYYNFDQETEEDEALRPKIIPRDNMFRLST